MTSTRSINPVPFNLYYSQRHVILKKKKKDVDVDIIVTVERNLKLQYIISQMLESFSIFHVFFIDLLL